jgi:hypothetical protein
MGTLSALPSPLLLRTILSAGNATSAAVSIPRPAAVAPLAPIVFYVAINGQDSWGATLPGVETPRSLR